MKEQKVYDTRFKKWQEENPEEIARRIDKINDIEIQGLKRYWITRSGKVLSFVGKTKILKPEILKQGYERIDLSGIGRFRVNRLVAETFKNELNIPEPLRVLPFKCLAIHHLNGNLLDNKITNLLAIPSDLHTFLHRIDLGKPLTDEQKRTLDQYCELYSQNGFWIVKGLDDNKNLIVKEIKEMKISIQKIEDRMLLKLMYE